MFWIGILSLLFFLIVGAISFYRDKNKLLTKVEEISVFMNLLVEYFQTNGDMEKFAELSRLSNRIQSIMGNDGFIIYKDNLRGFQHTHFPLIVNGIMILQDENNSFSQERRYQMFQMMIGALNRRIGSLEAMIDDVSFNPLYLILEGYRCVFSFIFKLLFIALFIPNLKEKQITGKIVKSLSALSMLASFIWTVIQIFNYFTK